MTDESRSGRETFPIGMFFWFIASTGGLLFIVWHGNPSQIPQNFFLAYFVFMFLNFLAFEGGWVFGGMFHEWWAGYVFVFTIAAPFSIALWILWYVNVFIPTTLPLSQNEVLTTNAVTISNLAAMLFVILIIPASCGVYFRRRKA